LDQEELEMPTPINTLRIVFANRKGGVGKTTLSMAVAATLAKRGHNVYGVDLDTQSSASIATGMNPLAEGTAEFLAGQSPNFQEVLPGFKLLAGGPALERFQHINAGTLMARLSSGDIPEESVVVMDTAPSGSEISRAALAIADVVCIIGEPHPLSLSGTSSILGALTQEQRRILILNRVDHRKKLHRQFCEGVSAALSGLEVLTVRADSELERKVAEGCPVTTGRAFRAMKEIDQIVSWIFPGHDVVESEVANATA